MTILAINWGNALIVTFVGIGIVFLILCLLIVLISFFGVLMAPKARVKKVKKEANSSEAKIEVSASRDYIPALDSAAIAMAVHMYFDEMHDEESQVITIKTVERRYSPWNSKIYGLNNNFTR